MYYFIFLLIGIVIFSISTICITVFHMYSFKSISFEYTPIFKIKFNSLYIFISVIVMIAIWLNISSEKVITIKNDFNPTPNYLTFDEYPIIHTKYDNIRMSFILNTQLKHSVININDTVKYNFPKKPIKDKSGNISLDRTDKLKLHFDDSYIEHQFILSNCSILINDLKSKSPNVVGVIGIDLLQKYNIIIDYKRNRIYIDPHSSNFLSNYE